MTEGFASLLAYDPESPARRPTPRPWRRRRPTSSPARSPGRCATPAATAGPIREGDWLGIAREGIVAIDEDLSGAATTLLSELVGDEHEIVTIIEGEGATTATTRHLEVWVHDNRPGCEVEIHHGGQPLYPYLLGIE